MSLVVYTAITGHFASLDILRKPLVKPTRPTRFVVYSDAIWAVPKPWEIRRPVWQHDVSDRRTARYHKLNSHLLFPDEEFVLWMDGSHQLAEDPWKIVDNHMGEADRHFFAFKHAQRSCVYEELAACRKLRKDDPEIMQAQVSRYKAAGYPAQSGLYDTSSVLRRTGTVTRDINTNWWRELAGGSLRDQLSINYVLWEQNLARHCGVMPGCRDKSPYFVFYPHR